MRKTTHFQKAIKLQQGVGLLEILITVLILAIGSLGVASLQLTGLRYSAGAYGRTQATLLSNDLMDRIRTNKTYAKTDGANYVVSTPTSSSSSSKNCHSVSCTAEEMANFDISKWLESVNRLLVDGKGKVSINTTSTTPSETTVEISLQWRQSVTKEGQTGPISDGELQEITFKSEI